MQLLKIVSLCYVGMYYMTDAGPLNLYGELKYCPIALHVFTL